MARRESKVKSPEVKADRTIMTPRGIAYRPAGASGCYLVAEISSQDKVLRRKADAEGLALALAGLH
ncbi:MAG: hypothetical protein RQ853_03345, partial [Acidianus sp.]|nr:hypothetical protein [Acidianus sp.]